MSLSVSPERLLAFQILKQSFEGKKLGTAFDQAVSGLTSQQHQTEFRISQVYNLVHGVARRYYPLSSYIASKVKKEPPQSIHIILMMGLYELSYNESTKSYATVDQALKLCESLKLPSYKALLNAVLRGFLREMPTSKKQLQSFSMLPPPVLGELLNTFPELRNIQEQKKFFNFLTEPAPIFLNVNVLLISRDELYQRLSSQGIELEMLDYDTIKTIKTFDPRVFQTVEFSEGLFFVQDLSSQIATGLLAPLDEGMKILDICSAPGGKAMSMALQSNDKAQITAMDVSSRRLIRLYENIRRLKLKSVKPMEADILETEYEASDFDRIFLDPPCTALGVIRRNPDVLWANKTQAIKELSTLQLRMLVRSMELLKPKGRLLYSVCTFTRAETVDVISKASAINKGFRLVAEPIYTLINREGMDGLFIALMEKK